MRNEADAIDTPASDAHRQPDLITAGRPPGGDGEAVVGKPAKSLRGDEMMLERECVHSPEDNGGAVGLLHRERVVDSLRDLELVAEADDLVSLPVGCDQYEGR